MPRLSPRDWCAASLLAAATIAIFGASAGRLGFYADDGGWLVWLTRVQPSELWDVLSHYMPGRNLHPLWHYLVYQLVGDPFGRLPVVHLVQSTLDGMVVAAFFLVLRLLGLPAFAAWTAAGLFAFWPFHGETHFWLEALPMNLVSTLWLLVAVATTTLLVQGRRGGWLWVLDFLAFAGALFTYDQVLPVLALLVVVRLAVLRSRALGQQAPHVAAMGFLVWLRLTQGGGPAPRGDLPSVVLENLRETTARSFGSSAVELAQFLNRNATTPDRQLAVLAAVFLAVGMVWLWKREPPGARPSRWLLPLGLAAWALAFLPAWMWWPAPRHYYLPSLGLFTAGGVLLTRLGSRFQAAWLRGGVAAAAGAAAFLSATAGRGESRLWERSFQARRQVFEELRPRLAAAEVVVLEDFPFVIGPALFVTPQDPVAWVQYLRWGERPQREVTGALSSAPAPGGLFLHTAYGEGPPPFEYRATDRFVVVRFTGWHGDRAQYEVNRETVPYEVIPHVPRGGGPPGVENFAARRDGEDLVVSLIGRGPERAGKLVAVFGFRQNGKWERWGRRNLDGYWIPQPVLLGDAPQWTGEIRLRDFPASDGVRVELHHSRGGRNELLGRAEAQPGPGL